MKDLIIHCSTQELWNKVNEKLSSERGVSKMTTLWNKDHVMFSIGKDNYSLQWSSKQYAEKEYSHIPITPAEEYLKEDKIIKSLDGINVGDIVEYTKGEKTYQGYVAVIDPRDTIPYLLRLENYSGFNDNTYWNEKMFPWFPQSERKDKSNCWWAKKESFKVVEETVDSRGKLTIDSIRKQLEKLHEYEISSTYNSDYLYIPNFTNQYDEDYLTNKHMLQKLTSTIKRLLNKNLQTQYRAGYINGGFELTDRGKDALLSLLAIDKEKELAELAQDFIDEVESEE